MPKFAMTKPRFLIKHVGNMGDLIFLVPPALETLKRVYPECHITFITAWGFKERRWWFGPVGWGNRNQDGFCITLMMTNPHIDQLVHWHDTALSLEGTICHEEGRSFPTWSKNYYEQQKQSGAFDAVFELDFGLKVDDNPLQRVYEVLGLPEESYTNYKLYFTEADRAVAAAVVRDKPSPRIVLLEGLSQESTRGWDPAKVSHLEEAIEKKYGVQPLWFGSQHVPQYQGRRLTLRENIATLTHGDVAIGVLSGPLHMAAAVGIPTLTLYCDHPMERAAPAFFLNSYIKHPHKRHRTLLGPSPDTIQTLKPQNVCTNLTPAEAKGQGFRNWQHPGKQATKCCVAVLTVDEVMAVLSDML